MHQSNGLRFRGATILGIGTATPKFKVDTQTSADFAERTSFAAPSHSRRVKALYRRSGIEHRGCVLLAEDDASDLLNEFYPPALSNLDRGPSTELRSQRYAAEAPVLGLASCQRALQQSGVSANEITHLVSVSCTGFSAPGIDIALIDQLKLPITTERVQVGFMGCHGAINGIRAARGLIASDDARVLLCSVELCSLHYQYGVEADQIISNALFADGSGALVLTSPTDPNCGQTERGQIVATGSCLVPASRDAMTWQIGDHGYEMTLSAQVPSLIETHLSSFLETWLAEQGESIASIGGWAVHPGGTRILSAVEQGLSLGPDALTSSREVLRKHGNMSSATMLFVLEHLESINQPKPWLMLGFGPGLEIEVALIR